jgi:hypothetical protein
MQTFLTVLVIGVGVLVLCFIVTLRVARATIHHPPPAPPKLPNGHAAERAAALARDSEAYRNYLISRLIVRSEERHRGQRG